MSRNWTRLLARGSRDPRRRLPLPLVVLLGGLLGTGGCAHGPRGAQGGPGGDENLATADWGPLGRPAYAELSKGAPVLPKDARYRLPPAQQRSLTIFLNSQTFEYVEDGKVVLSGKVSSGRPADPTPKGDYRILSKILNKRSGKYSNILSQPTPMPYSLQFYGNYFVHEGWLPGYPDSPGCVYMNHDDARLLFHRIRIGDPVQVRGEGVSRPASFQSSPAAGR